MHEHQGDFVCIKCSHPLLQGSQVSNGQVTQQDLHEILLTSSKLLNLPGAQQVTVAPGASEKVIISSKFQVESAGDVYQEIRDGDKIYTMGPDGMLQLNERVSYNIIKDARYVPDPKSRIYVPKKYEDWPPLPAVAPPAPGGMTQGSARGSLNGAREHMEAEVRVTVEKPAKAPQTGPNPNTEIMQEIERLRIEAENSKREAEQLKQALQAKAQQAVADSELRKRAMQQSEELRRLQQQVVALLNQFGQSQNQGQLSAQIQSILSEMAQNRAKLEEFLNQSQTHGLNLRQLEEQTQQGFSYLTKLIADIQRALQSSSGPSQQVPDFSGHFQGLAAELARLRAELEQLKHGINQQNQKRMHNHPIEIITTEIKEERVDKVASSANGTFGQTTVITQPTQIIREGLHITGSPFYQDQVVVKTKDLGGERPLGGTQVNKLTPIKSFPRHIFTEAQGNRQGANSRKVNESLAVSASAYSADQKETQSIKTVATERLLKFEDEESRSKYLSTFAGASASNSQNVVDHSYHRQIGVHHQNGQSHHV